MNTIIENINAWTKKYIKSMIESIQLAITTNAATGNFTTLATLTQTPVNAVAASKVLTVGGTPSEGDTVSMGGVIYKARLTALGAGVAASAVLTSDQTAPADGDTVTIGTRVYRFKTTMAQANDIQLGTATASMLALFKAIHLTGAAGTDYFAGTQAIAIAATAVHTSTFVITLTANSVGYAGNLFAKAASSSHLDWDGTGAYFTGGIDAQAVNDVYCTTAESFIDNLVLAVTAGSGAGTNYGTGTVVNPLVTAVKASASTMTCTNLIKGVIGNATVVAKSGTNFTWASSAVLLSGGVNGTVGIKGQITWDGTYLYICNLTNTIADANWKRLGSFASY